MRRKKTPAFTKMSEPEIHAAIAEARTDVRTVAAQSKTLPREYREAALSRMNAGAAVIDAATRELAKRGQAVGRAVSAEARRSGNLAPWEQEAHERQQTFAAEIAEARRQEALARHAERERQGLNAQPPAWRGFKPEVLAVLASAHVQQLLRGFVEPGTEIIDELGEVVVNADATRKRGGYVGSMLEVEELGILAWALALIVERGDPFQYRRGERGIKPGSGTADVDRALKRLTELHLLRCEVVPGQGFTIGLGSESKRLMQAFAATYPATTTQPVETKPKRRLRRETKPEPPRESEELVWAREQIAAGDARS